MTIPNLRLAQNALLLACKLVFYAIFTTSAHAQATFDQAKLDAFFDVLATNNRLVGTVSLTKDGVTLYERRLEDKNTTDRSLRTTPTGSISVPTYRVGSVTKLFTSVIVFQLIEEGKLSLDTKLSLFFPQVANSDKITIDHLLSHTSGIPSFELQDDYDNWRFDPHNRVALLKRYTGYKPQFAPGEKWSYSNTGYVLLANIIEDVTKTTYAQAINDRIALRLSLKNTKSVTGANSERHLVPSYRVVDGKWEPERPVALANWLGAADLISTPAELNVFMTALFSHKLISAQSLATMTQTSEKNMSVGKDIFRGKISPEIDKEIYFHHGGIDEYASYAAYLPDGGYALAFSFNGNNFPRAHIFFAVWNAVFQKPITIPSFASIKLSAESLVQFEGAYRSDRSRERALIKLEQGNLTFRFSNMKTPVTLTPISETTFVNDATGRIIEFRTIDDGKTMRLRHFYGRGDSIWTKPIDKANH
jgi:D-alanyl-D-alanine carboxypeptidase